MHGPGSKPGGALQEMYSASEVRDILEGLYQELRHCISKVFDVRAVP